ncbi:MAG: hypothetical protein ACHQU0_03065 [Candidatus Paceibacteria bacterium]
MSDKPEIDALLVAAKEQTPIEFQKQVGEILGQRVSDALMARQQVAAASMLSQEEPTDGEGEEHINSDETSNEPEDPDNGEDGQAAS